MTTYKVQSDGGVLRDDGLSIPPDPANGYWQAYQAWLSAGNVPTPYAPPAFIPLATPYQIALALNGSGQSSAFDAALPKAKASDRVRWNSRTDPLPASNLFYRRICTLAGVDPDAIHAAAVSET